MSLSASPTFDAAAGAAAGSAAVAARIGPNAVLQLVESLAARDLADLTGPLFRHAGVADWLEAPPRAMVDERRVARLHREVRTVLPTGEANATLAEAGRRTADYILANRIPAPARALLKTLPAGPAAGMLVAAIRANAWTFAGSSRFEATAKGSQAVFILRGNPLCAGEIAAEPVCVWHAAVFQRLFQVLVSRRASVVETHCEARGDDRCRFVADWG